MHIALIQPRSPWGRQPYLPNGLLSVAARCMSAGLGFQLFDENLGIRLADRSILRQLRAAEVIGIGALGSPYIPEAIRVAGVIRAAGCQQPVLIGGEPIMRLSPEQFDRLFGRFGSVKQIKDEEDLGPILNLRLPSMYDTSLAPTLRALPSHVAQAYFRKEWCLFTSQGCIFRCHFCAATKGVAERFRGRPAFEEEAACLIDLVHRHAGSSPRYEVYCSTLDGCQTPDQMEWSLQTMAQAASKRGVRLKLRFLATAKCLVMAARQDPSILARWRSYGLQCIGIGVDGDDPVVWRRENKSHNTTSDVAGSFDLITQAGLQAEALMVIGFPNDAVTSTWRAMRACFRFTSQGVRPRPYLGKAHAPGSKGWSDGGTTVDRLLAQPRLFRELDYSSLGSPLTHPQSRMRWVVNCAYLLTVFVLKLTPLGCPTAPLLPSESVGWPYRMLARLWNRMMPQDR